VGAEHHTHTALAQRRRYLIGTDTDAWRQCHGWFLCEGRSCLLIYDSTEGVNRSERGFGLLGVYAMAQERLQNLAKTRRTAAGRSETTTLGNSLRDAPQNWVPQKS